MKNDTSKVIDLDNLLQLQQEVITKSPVIETQAVSFNWEDILTEWSYRCPKGYPTMVDGVFSEREEVEILNEILEEKGLQELPLPEAAPVVNISTNKTDVKEAMVMVFYDCLRTTPTFAKLYQAVYASPTQESMNTFSQALTRSTSLGSDYGSGVNIPNLHKYIVEILQSPNRNKTNKDLSLVNNGFSAANTIFSDSIITQYVQRGKGWTATRGSVFNAIRKNAVSLFQSININLSYPDNWCPGDFYLMKKVAVPAEDNIIDFNSHFRGPGYENGDIFAISLKMEDAQAGKGTTFLQTVLQPKAISASKAHATNVDSKTGKQYLEAKRRLAKIDTYQDPSTFYAKISGYAKFLSKLLNNPKSTQTIDALNNLKGKDAKIAYFFKNRKAILQEMLTITSVLDKQMLGSAQTAAYEKGFEDSFKDFVKYLSKIGIKRTDSKNVADFIKDIKASKGAKEAGGLAKLLIKKADTYALAIKLIQSWSDQNKVIAKPFKRLGSIDNPLLAITMFAIAQHGANPNFAKVHGSNTGMLGTADLFPAKSKVNKDSMIQSASVRDTPGAAGFDVVYNLKLNNRTYSTKLTFRFSADQIRVEVQELEEIGK